jgi:hypothetical protein
MSDKDIPYEVDAVCDECGTLGAYDFMGDCLCPECALVAIGRETSKASRILAIPNLVEIDPNAELPPNPIADPPDDREERIAYNTYRQAQQDMWEANWRKVKEV